MREMLELFKGADGDATFDSTYLSRKMCTKLAALVMTPFVHPKSNTTSKSKGSHAWKMMVEMYQNSKEEFDGRYHKRSIAEAVYAAIKAMYGNALRTRIMRTQTHRGHDARHGIVRNVEMVTRINIESGSLNEERIRTAIVC